jgi:N-acetyltransferase 10
MIKLLDSEVVQGMDSSWLKEYFKDFRRRFLSLLAYQFKVFAPSLALSILQNKGCQLDDASGNLFTVFQYFVFLKIMHSFVRST